MASAAAKSASKGAPKAAPAAACDGCGFGHPGGRAGAAGDGWGDQRFAGRRAPAVRLFLCPVCRAASALAPGAEFWSVADDFRVLMRVAAGRDGGWVVDDLGGRHWSARCHADRRSALRAAHAAACEAFAESMADARAAAAALADLEAEMGPDPAAPTR